MLQAGKLYQICDIICVILHIVQVIVIDKGTIAEEGTHEELIAKDGVYKKLVLRQLTAGESMRKTEGESLEEEEDKDSSDSAIGAWKDEPGRGRDQSGGGGGIMRMMSWS